MHTYEEPILNIISASNSQTGESISEIIISGITIDDNEYDLGTEHFLDFESESENILREDSKMICSIPCGFGNMSGKYSLEISGNGYQEKLFEVDATYGSGGGGCPSFSDDGTKVNLSLQPAD